VITKTKKIIIRLLIFGFALLYVPQATALDTLVGTRDVISRNDIGEYAEHTITLGLSAESAPIETDDYIFLDMPHFSNVTVPTFISGTNITGTPAFLVLGYRIRITGIAVAAGSYITIHGITASNPTQSDKFDVFIRISDDPLGNTARNEAHLIATKIEGSITVTALLPARVGTLQISGLSAPNMFITFTEGSTVIGTCASNATGVFSQVFPGIDPVIHNISIFGVDAEHRTTPASSVEIFTRPYELTAVTGVVLAPTVSIDKTDINRGESISISGRSVPNYKTIIFTKPPFSAFDVMADANGKYEYTILDTNSLPTGDHDVYALSQDGLGVQSSISLTAFFKVKDITPPDDPGQGPTCDIIHGDLNCDNKVNIIDFSIMLYFWRSNSAFADINRDGNVNIVDFSIMMYYWQG